MIVLGLNAFHGDVSAVLLRDGYLISAIEEERFRRVKHWAGFPRDAIRACLEEGDISPEEVDHFAVSRNPKAHFLRKAMFALWNRPNIGLIRDRLKNSSQVLDLSRAISESIELDQEQVKKRIHWVEHHPAHLASSFFVSPFEEAAVCAIDGFGDFVSTSFAEGRGASIKRHGNVYFPHSLGILYLAITQYLGFPNYGDEFKVMGLAPYGEADFVDEISRLVSLRPGGGFALDLSYFSHWRDGGGMTWESGEPTIGRIFTDKLESLLGPSRRRDDPLEPKHEAIAASLQVVFERAALHVLDALHEKTRLSRLCLAGGCAMNSVMNGKIRENTPFEEIYIQPASADNGTALGAAYHVWHQVLGNSRCFEMEHAYWGHAFGPEEIGKVIESHSAELKRTGCTVNRMDKEDALYEWTSGRIASGEVVGWFQGRMEWGSRALGNRSILADPRRADMREIINLKIKYREKFRPFAPSILEESLDEYFLGAVPDPFMIQVYPVRPDKREIIPAVTHVDGSGRLQTVGKKTNPVYWKLIKAFETRTGVPVLLNTSFNENEPIVQHPSEAIDCFLRTNMDVLVMGPYTIMKDSPA